MKQKSSFNKITEVSMQEIANRSVPLMYKPWLKFKRFLQKRPKTSAVVMLVIALINIAILFKHTLNSKSIPYSFNGSQSPSSGDWGADMGIPFSFENYRTMKSIQDTLSWLAAKKNRTAADTAVLLRLIDKIEKLDPLFFDKIKKATHGKDSITGNRNDTTKRNH